MNSTTEPPAGIDGGFLRVLQEYLGGVMLTEAAIALREVNEGVALTNKRGKLTIHLHVLPSGDNAASVMIEVDKRVPRRKAPTAIFFMDDGHNLTRNNPNQAEIKLRVAENPNTQPAGEIKEVAK